MTPGPATPSAPAPPRRAGRVLAAVSAVIAVLAIAGVAFVSGAARPASHSPVGAAAASARTAAGAVGGAGGVVGAAGVGGVGGTAAVATAAKPPHGMAQVPLTSLPKEAQQVVAEIDHGGPFRYRQDGVTFLNRERRLPAEPRGYYREYTVDTPGSADRGPRRIVAGRGGELYYSADHYGTFQWIVRNGSAS